MGLAIAAAIAVGAVVGACLAVFIGYVAVMRAVARGLNW